MGLTQVAFSQGGKLGAENLIHPAAGQRSRVMPSEKIYSNIAQTIILCFEIPALINPEISD